jgi:hypothetical protein
MTAGTISNDGDMINFIRRVKSNGCVAIFAAVGRKNMIGIFRGCYHTIVAELTVSGNPFMIKHGIMPGVCTMTVIADITAFDVSRMFTDRDYAIMAALTFPSDGKVVNPGDVFPVAGLVTKLTVIGGSHVFG